MFEESPIYYILISLIFLIIFGSIAMATWMVWLTAVHIAVKVGITIGGVLLAAFTILFYIASAE